MFSYLKQNLSGGGEEAPLTKYLKAIDMFQLDFELSIAERDSARKKLERGGGS